MADRPLRLAVLSDLHVEFQAFEPAPALADADVVVLAGDIHNGLEALRWARRCFPAQRIVQVAGNHEFFGHCWQDLLPALRAEARRLGIDFLERDAIVIDGVRFLGATLWTDFELFTVPGRPLAMDATAAMAVMQRRMVDFRLIRWRDGGPGPERPLEPADTAMLHHATRSWLDDALAQPFDGPTVVVSHHLPSFRSVAPAFLRAASNAAFASDVDHLVARADLWIHGHTHHSFDYRLGPARVVANPRGYPMRDGSLENPVFDGGRLVVIGGRAALDLSQ